MGDVPVSQARPNMIATMHNSEVDELRKAFSKEMFSSMMKANIRSRYPEPLASMLCKQLDDAKTFADFLESMAKQMRG